MLKDELWKRRLVTEAEIVMFRRNQIVEEITLLEKIQRNNTREQEVQKKIMVKYGKIIKWYIWRKKSIYLTIRKFKNKFYKKIMNQQI